MNYAAELGSIDMIYIRNFVKTGSVIQKLKGGGIHTYVTRRLRKFT
jgi:hypothetical protein